MNAPIFEFHGLRVDCIDKHESNSKDRINVLQCRYYIWNE